MFSQTTEYAFQAMAYLAAHPGSWHEVGAISRELGIPADYLSKVLGQFVKLGLLDSKKGWGGGFRLKEDPATIRLERVARPLEGENHPRVCILGFDRCSDDEACPLHEYWKGVCALQEQMLRKTTLDDLAKHLRKEQETRIVPRGVRQKARRGNGGIEGER